MNNKMLAILGTTVITIGTIGSVAFASTVTDNDFKDNQKIEGNVNKDKKGFNGRNCHNSSNDGSKNMVEIMTNNGFEDAAKYMQSGDYDSMEDYMKNISEEDYNKMIKVMNENGYENMGKMMKSIGRKGVIQMHKTMGSMNNRGVRSMMNRL